MVLFKVKELEFTEKYFLDEIDEFRDIILILQDYQKYLTYEEIECFEKNDCCNGTKKNYLIELKGFINEEDEFISEMELIEEDKRNITERLEPFVIQVYKCIECKKWIINLLELE